MRSLLVILVTCFGCHDAFDGVFPYVCDPVNAVELPTRLSETGLYASGTEQIADEVLAYRPRFELWSDGATKERWIYLPPDAVIDTTDTDDWRFPEGTRMWKEFTRDGVRIETRLLAKLGPGDGDWAAIAYRWEGADAIAVPAGHVDANGTAHDIPAAGECVACHGGRPSFALGVSAIQLAAPARAGEIGLEDLEASGRLSRPPPANLEPPGDATAVAALGTLHANCGHCHADDSAANKPCFVPDNALAFWLAASALDSVEDTPAFASLAVVDPQLLLTRMMSRDDVFSRMPPLGSRDVDVDGVAAVRAWIEELR